MNKRWALFSPFAALVLAACGHSGQQATASAQSAPVAITASTAATATHGVQPLDSSVLAAAKSTGQPCSLDSIDGKYSKQVSMVAGKPHTFRGWMLGPERQPAGSLEIILIGKRDFAIDGKTGVPRSDVGGYLKDPALALAGFSVVSTLREVPEGTYQAKLLVVRHETPYLCAVEKSVVMTSAAAG